MYSGNDVGNLDSSLLNYIFCCLHSHRETAFTITIRSNVQSPFTEGFRSFQPAMTKQKGISSPPSDSRQKAMAHLYLPHYNYILGSWGPDSVLRVPKFGSQHTHHGSELLRKPYSGDMMHFSGFLGHQACK